VWLAISLSVGICPELVLSPVLSLSKGLSKGLSRALAFPDKRVSNRTPLAPFGERGRTGVAGLFAPYQMNSRGLSRPMYHECGSNRASSGQNPAGSPEIVVAKAHLFLPIGKPTLGGSRPAGLSGLR